MNTPRCALGRIIPASLDAEEVKRDGWVEHGILVIAVDDPRLGVIDREFIRQLGNRLFGTRNKS